ncbi:hypothetical protein B0H13DRAFT_2373360 [Mycena leptocephala]|nr:hypothetical protein B0H13DRAFT_2373360 [Mycena leptocephala]
MQECRIPRFATQTRRSQKLRTTGHIAARFPTELHDYIIDHLHNDKQSLSACSLVCRALSAPNKYQLFQRASTIHVHRSNFRQFCELLATQQPNPYIGRLHLESHIVENSSTNSSNLDLLQLNSDLHRLSGLACLRYLRLDYHHDTLLPAFFAALTQNFRGITDLEFTSMHFESFGQFVEMVDSLRLLRRVTLAQVVWYDHLADYTYSDSEDVTLIPVYAPSTLTDFVLSIRRLAIGRLNSEVHTILFSIVLRALGPRLEHLIILPTTLIVTPDLSHAIALHTFEITGIFCIPENTRASFEWLLILLSQLN